MVAGGVWGRKGRQRQRSVKARAGGGKNHCTCLRNNTGGELKGKFVLINGTQALAAGVTRAGRHTQVSATVGKAGMGHGRARIYRHTTHSRVGEEGETGSNRHSLPPASQQGTGTHGKGQHGEGWGSRAGCVGEGVCLQAGNPGGEAWWGTAQCQNVWGRVGEGVGRAPPSQHNTKPCRHAHNQPTNPSQPKPEEGRRSCHSIVLPDTQTMGWGLNHGRWWGGGGGSKGALGVWCARAAAALQA